MTGARRTGNKKSSGVAEWKALLQVSVITVPTKKFTINAFEIYELVRQLPSRDLPILHKVFEKEAANNFRL
jgi:hypothetical protein